MDERRQITMPELDRREVDRHVQRAGPGRRLAAGLAQNPFPDLHDEAAVLGERNEGRGRDQPAFRMPPPYQRLEAHNLAADPRLRLVEQGELLVLDGRAELVLKRAALAQLVV